MEQISNFTKTKQSVEKYWLLDNPGKQHLLEKTY